MRVLVTGATGFLGAHLVEALLERGHEVRALVRQKSDTRHLARPGVELLRGSLAPAEGLGEAVEGAEAILHCAGGGRVSTTRELYRQNADTTRNLLDAALAARARPRSFVLVSSLSARGPTPDAAPLPAGSPDCPVSHYGKSKREAERATLLQSREMRVAVVRPPAIYGPRDDRWLGMFRAARRGWVPVVSPGLTSIVYGPDCARALCALVECDSPSGRIYTVDDGEARSWGELGTLIGATLGKSPRAFAVPQALLAAAGLAGEAMARLRGRPSFLSLDKVRDARGPHWVCDSEAIGRDTGWAHRTSFAEGAEATARWYRDQGLL
ncbi:NAD-dependent epimerase/dehydratase family protein [Polyangium aurulentum]|uniref:NAD-dependent epimerase/dehydratase family protein n=1 Tax=Polyangium aurulentum TaxID=2567896 RepID=UPI00146F46CA|nr:NAD-dependent epimerase/dehydratase family protein [Polyangium aurulentum]UQA62905.1 NAD-dependent epimerase/dehydratase family protein [Polyangium aurulentum]